MKIMKFVMACAAAIALMGLGAGSAMAIDTYGMKAHAKAGLTCDSCHNAQRVEANCLTCHANSNGTYRGKLDAKGNGVEKSYPESRKTKNAAMHDSHLGPVRCTVCHTAHSKEPAKLYCNNCHQFEVVIK